MKNNFLTEFHLRLVFYFWVWFFRWLAHLFSSRQAFLLSNVSFLFAFRTFLLSLDFFFKTVSSSFFFSMRKDFSSFAFSSPTFAANSSLLFFSNVIRSFSLLSENFFK